MSNLNGRLSRRPTRNNRADFVAEHNRCRSRSPFERVQTMDENNDPSSLSEDSKKMKNEFAEYQNKAAATGIEAIEKCDRLEKLVVELQKTNADQQKINADLQKTNADQQKSINELKGKVKDLEEKVGALEKSKRCSKCQKSLDNKKSFCSACVCKSLESLENGVKNQITAFAETPPPTPEVEDNQ